MPKLTKCDGRAILKILFRSNEQFLAFSVALIIMKRPYSIITITNSCLLSRRTLDDFAF